MDETIAVSPRHIAVDLCDQRSGHTSRPSTWCRLQRQNCNSHANPRHQWAWRTFEQFFNFVQIDGRVISTVIMGRVPYTGTHENPVVPEMGGSAPLPSLSCERFLHRAPLERGESAFQPVPMVRRSLAGCTLACGSRSNESHRQPSGVSANILLPRTSFSLSGGCPHDLNLHLGKRLFIASRGIIGCAIEEKL
jgi:hypothetical protein